MTTDSTDGRPRSVLGATVLAVTPLGGAAASAVRLTGADPASVRAR